MNRIGLNWLRDVQKEAEKKLADIRQEMAMIDRRAYVSDAIVGLKDVDFIRYHSLNDERAAMKEVVESLDTVIGYLEYIAENGGEN